MRQHDRRMMKMGFGMTSRDIRKGQAGLTSNLNTSSEQGERIERKESSDDETDASLHH